MLTKAQSLTRRFLLTTFVAAPLSAALAPARVRHCKLIRRIEGFDYVQYDLTFLARDTDQFQRVLYAQLAEVNRTWGDPPRRLMRPFTLYDESRPLGWASEPALNIHGLPIIPPTPQAINRELLTLAGWEMTSDPVTAYWIHTSR